MGDLDLHDRKFLLFQEIARAFVSMDSINSIANHLLDLAISHTDAEKGSLMLINEKGELYILASRDIDISFVRNYKANIGEGIAGIVAKNRSAVLVEDVEKDPRFKGLKRDRYKTRSFISCPVISRKKLLGVLNINDKKDKAPFTEEEFELIKVIADQVAIALENAFLMNQLKSKAVELEEVNRKLIDMDIAKTEFLTRISHEVRTPLNSIKGAIYYLQKSGTLERAKQDEFFSIISDEAGNLASVIENLLDFIRLEDDMKAMNKTVIPLADLLRDTLNSNVLRNELKKKKLRLELNIDEDIPDIIGDKIKVVQFYINLIEGLSIYLKEGDTIKVSTHKNDFVEVCIDLSREMPEVVGTYLLNAKKIYDTNQPEEIVKLYLARKVAEAHYWSLEMHNDNGACSLCIKILKNADQKIEAAMTVSMDMFVELISNMLNVDICSIMLADDLTGDLTIKSSRGLSNDIMKQTRIRPGDKIAGWVALEGKPLIVRDIENDLRFGKKSISQYTTKSLISLPLKLHNKVVGVLNLNNKKNSEDFTMRDFHIASLLGERVAYFINRFTSGELSESDLKRFMKSFDSLITIEKKYHKKHAVLTDLITGILDELGATEEDKHIAQYISLVYDLGLMLVDENIARKQNFTETDAHSLKYHPYNSVFLLDSLEFSETVKTAILHHHERYDGAGYPDGLKGDDIPFLSRVIAVADSFFAMITDRPGRSKISREKALEEIKQGAGSLYDPAVTEALEKTLKQERLQSQRALK